MNDTDVSSTDQEQKPQNTRLQQHIETVASWLRLLIEPGQVFEIRVLGLGGPKRVHSGYFDYDHIQHAAAEAVRLSALGARAVYFTLNVVNHDVIARRCNRIDSAGQDFPLTSTSDIVRRYWLLIDCDPIRTAGVSSTNDEHAASLSVAESIFSWLSSLGWPLPIVADSGNGTHLLYRIDLPTDDGELIKRILRAVSLKFTTSQIDIDTSVYDPPRICKLYGTVGRKGDSTPDRPHRQSRILRMSRNGNVLPVPDELLKSLAATAPQDPKAKRPAKMPKGSNTERCRAYVKTIEAAIAGQHGHDQTYYVACIIAKDFALPHEFGWPILCEFNERCEPPWDEVKLQKKWDDAVASSGETGGLLKDTRGLPSKVSHNNQYDPLEVETADQPRPEQTQLIGIDDIDPLGNRQQKSIPDDTIGPVRNYTIEVDTLEDGTEKEIRVPAPICSIIGSLQSKTGDWPQAVGKSLFYHDNRKPDHFDWLPDCPSVFALVGRITGYPPDFIDKSGFHTKSEVFSELKRTATSHEAVESFPHFPPRPGAYYTCPQPAPGDGSAMRDFLSRFSPETEHDASLLIAALVTVFWGGRCGGRPMFCITADGRGSGKSTLVELISLLCGGRIEPSINESIELIKQRLLSPEGLLRRVVFLDNLKTLKFSWAELEALITATVVSGKRMYVGESQRPNTLTFFSTLNGISLGKDMAQRTVVIRLKRPEYSPSWRDDIEAFVTAHKQAILADVAAFFASPLQNLDVVSRWDSWDRDIIARLPDAAELQSVIRERQSEADAENEENQMLEESFAARLRELDFDPTRAVVFIPSPVVRDWYCMATDERESATRVTKILKQRIEEKQILRLSINRRNDVGRGLVWTGVMAQMGVSPDFSLQDRKRARDESKIVEESRLRHEGRKLSENQPTETPF